MEFVGIILVGIRVKTYILAVIGFCLTNIGKRPIYPSIQNLTTLFFGKDTSATVIGLQMASAYVGTTLMPFVSGLIQSKISMWAHPIYAGVFTVLNCNFIEIEFKLCDKNVKNNFENEEKKENEENNKSIE